MTKIRPDKIVLSSITPGFGKHPDQSTSIVISGSIPNGGKDFTGSITVPEGSFVESYYWVGSSDRKSYIPAIWSMVTGVSSGFTGIYQTQTGTTINYKVFIDNTSGGSLTVTTQTVNIGAYVFKSPF